MRGLFLIGLVFGLNSWAGQPAFTRPIKSIRITATGGNPIPQSFSASNPQSRVLSGLFATTNIKITNTTPCGIVVNAGHDGTAPSDNDSQNIYLLDPSKQLGILQEGLSMSGSVYLRSDCSPAADITSGTVDVEVW